MDLMIDPPCVHAIRDSGEILGYVAIDSTVRGRSLGGLRLAPDVSPEEVRVLARKMTLKYGLAGLPQGGAKAGLLGDPEAPEPERRARLEAFARGAAGLLRSRVYQPDTDMGTRAGDIHHMLGSIGVRVGPRAFRNDRSGHYTALTALAGAREALARKGRSLEGATAAIEGFGAVGSALGRLLGRSGVRVVAISTSRGALFREGGLDLPRLLAATEERGSAVIEDRRGGDPIALSELLELPVDILFPCARPFSIDAANAARIQARVVSPGANAPVSAEAERALHERDVAVIPDFVANSGGVIGGTMAFASVSEARIERFLLGRVGNWIRVLLEQAERTGDPPCEVAAPLAGARFEAIRRRAEHPNAAGRVVDALVELHRRRLLPRPLVGAFAPRWFEGALAPPPGPAGAR